MKILHFKSIDSTNAYLKSNYKSLDHMTWLSTDYQSAGKGRSRKPWFGDSDSLMCSVLLKTKLDYDHIPILPLLAAASLHKVLSYYDPNLLIKWPNDILFHDLKLAGILVESIIESDRVLAVIIGFGVNINNQSFDKTIQDIATSLVQTTKQIHAKENILELLIDQFQEDYEYFVTNPQFVIDYCNRFFALKDKTIVFTLRNQSIRAKVLSIDSNGHLIVESNTHKIALYSSEFTILK